MIQPQNNEIVFSNDITTQLNYSFVNTFGKIIIQGRQKIKFSVLPLGAKWNTQRGNTVALYNIY